MANHITFRIPVTSYRDVTLSKGMIMLLKHALFPAPEFNIAADMEITPSAQKVLAIKALRSELGLGLKEAKDIICAFTPEILDSALQGGDYGNGTMTLGDLLRSKLQTDQF